MLQWVRRVLQNPLSNTANYLSKVTGYASLAEYFACKRLDNPDWIANHKFYAKLHQVWNKFHCFPPTDEQGIRNEILWHNRMITSGGSSLTFPRLQRAGIKTVAHICHETEPRTLSHLELRDKFGVEISFLHMMTIRQSLPLHWRQSISTNGALPTPTTSDIEVKFGPNEIRDIHSLSAKAAYSLILGQSDHTPTALNTWQRGVEEVEISDKQMWAQACSGVYKITRETKLQSFHYKILHRIIPCNAYLTQIRIKDTIWCPFCDETDTITHFLFTCNKVQPFWRAICLWFRQADNIYLDNITAEEYMWGVQAGGHRANLLNAITLLVKFYVYRQKLYFNGELCLLQWLAELRSRLRTEQWISGKTGSRAKLQLWNRILMELG